MKKLLFILTTFLLIGVVSAQQARISSGVTPQEPKFSLADQATQTPSNRAVVYSEGFESTTGTPTADGTNPIFTPPLPTGWTKSNTTGHNWGTVSNLSDVPGCGDDFPPKTGSRMMYNTWSSAGNNWAFSPGFALTAGTAYTVSFWWNAMGWASDNEPDRFEVRIGNTATAAAMATATQVFNHPGTLYDFDFIWREATYIFNPTTDGTYYLGFHDLRNGPLYGLCIMIDDIKISSAGPSNDCPAVTGVTATLFEANKVKVNWTAPTVTADLTGYKVYEGGVEKATVPAGTTTWNSGALTNGTYKFEVAATYSTECDPVKVAAADIIINICDKKVTAVDVEYATDCSVATISWEAPAKGRSEVLWDNTAINVPSSGNNGLISSYWAGANSWVYTADDFAADAAWTIEKIHTKGFPNTDSPKPAKMSIVIYQDNGNKPGTEIFRENAVPVPAWTTENYFDNCVLTLPTPFTLPAAGKYWIAIAGAYDGAVNLTSSRWNIASGSTGIETNFHLHDPDNLFKTGVTTWQDAGPIVSPLKSMYFKLEGTAGTPPDPKYNVYRDNEKIAGPIEELTFDDITFDKTQSYTWSVAVVCPSGNDGEWVSVEKESCSVGINDFEKTGFSIAPNPATNSIRISAESNFNKVEIVNFLGQTVLTQLNDRNSATVDVSNLTNGVYFVRIISENGTSVQKFVKQ